jgi:hypothetical protein
MLYSQLEVYLKYRQQIQVIKQEIITDLQQFEKTITTESKHKKLKDRLTQLIETFLTKINEENMLHATVDGTRDALFKDLTDLRALLK